MADLVGEFLGSSQIIFNMIQQMNHFYNNISNIQENKIETYGPSEEIDFCLDGLTASKWEKEVEVTVNKCELPRKVTGDLFKFRVALRTMIEFGIKYSKDN